MNHSDEVVSFQRSTTDQPAIYICLRDKLFTVFGLHAAAIEDGHIGRNLSAEAASEPIANEGMRLLSLIGCSGFACANRPNRFIGDH